MTTATSAFFVMRVDITLPDRRRVLIEGTTSLAVQAEKRLKLAPYSGQVFVFKGRCGDLLKIIWWDKQGACLFSKRLEKARLVWSAAKEGKINVTPAQLSMLLEGLDWRMPRKTWRPLQTG